MAAPAKYATPPAQMFVLAVRARARTIVFADFWVAAIRPGKPPITTKLPPERWPPDAVVWPRDSWDREVWQRATREAYGGWQRAYEGLPPTRPEAALILLGPELRVDPALLAEILPATREALLPTTREGLVDLLRGLGAAAAVRSAA